MNNNFVNLGLVTLVTLILGMTFTYFKYNSNLLNFDDYMTKEQQERLNNWALTFIRVLIGLTFIKHGYDKVMGGNSEWIWMGQQMKNLGIRYGFLYWGLAAALAEFGGGLMLTLGFATRLFAFLLACVMFVATLHHINKGDRWGFISFPLSLLIVFIGFMIAGGGPYSIDGWIHNKKIEEETSFPEKENGVNDTQDSIPTEPVGVPSDNVNYLI